MDVKPDANAATPAVPGEATPQSEPQQTNQTASVQEPVVPEPKVTPQVAEPKAPDQVIPYSRFSQVNKERNELKKKLAELERNAQYSQYDPNDLNAILQHPMVQDLMIKDAKRQVTDYAKEYMDQFPGFPEQIRKAILANVRGFIKESTSDPESAKLDISEYIDSIVSEMQATQAPQPKGFPVASSNAPANSSSTRPADISKILEKPVDDWTDEESKIVEDYTKLHPNK